MFDAGFQEVVLIGVIALLVIGPERLPGVARSVGLWVGKMQRFVAGVKSDIHAELQTDELRQLLDSQEDQIRELKTMVDETRSDIKRSADTAKESIAGGMNQAAEQVREAAEVLKSGPETVTKDAAKDSASDSPAGVGISDSTANDSSVGGAGKTGSA